MKRPTWPLICLALAATTAVQARQLRDEHGNPLGGGGQSAPPAEQQRSAPVREAPGPQLPAMPTPPRPPGGPLPRFGNSPGNDPGNFQGNPQGDPQGRPGNRWSTQPSPPPQVQPRPPQVQPPSQGQPPRGVDRNWIDRNDRWQDTRRDDRWRDDDWQRRQVPVAPRRIYQWRDYDQFRLQHFRFDDGRYFGRSRYHAGAYLWPRGFGVRLWLVGQWLPSAFFAETRYQLDYWRYGLYQPPLGCRWVRVGDDALLVDDFNGEVLDAVYNLFW